MSIWTGDITTLEVDGIVNAANKSLLGGGGVDGAIHRAAGPELLEETKQLGGAETGEAKITKGYNLLAKHVIHTVGPVYKEGSQNEKSLLAACYKNALALAEEYQLKTIAFPAISTGVYGYPLDEATEIAIRTVEEKLPDLKHVKEIIFVTFDEPTFLVYEKTLQTILENKDDKNEK